MLNYGIFNLQIMGILLEFSHVPAIRKEMCSSIMNAKKGSWEILLSLANGDIYKSFHSHENQVVLSVIDVIKELTEVCTYIILTKKIYFYYIYIRHLGKIRINY